MIMMVSVMAEMMMVVVIMMFVVVMMVVLTVGDKLRVVLGKYGGDHDGCGNDCSDNDENGV